MDLSICVQDTLKSYQLILINILRDGLGMVQERCDQSLAVINILLLIRDYLGFFNIRSYGVN